jgi:hypothetical protein
MKHKIDTKFLLTTFIEEQEQTKHEYKSFKREIENNGCFKLKIDAETVKIYTPQLVVIFLSKELPAFNKETQIETTINGWEYLNTYIEAYKEGEQYFETEWKVSTNTLYGANAEQYVRDIHLNFFHIQHTGINEGWGYVKNSSPFILTHKAVREFGYYSGIVNKVEEQVKKYPQLFATFDKCEHTPPPEQTKTDKLKAELGKYGFFELSKVKQLSEPNKQSLVELININGLPYGIAMFEYLGFIKHLKAEHFAADYKLFKAVAKCFNVTDRAVKGNFYVLNKFSKENRTRYTADKQWQTVQKNYEALK